MSSSAVLTFNDPFQYQTAIRGAQVEICPTAKGTFHAELTQVTLPKLWMQHGRESGPRISSAVVPAERSVVFFPAGPKQKPINHSGMDVVADEIVVYQAGATHHHRTAGACRWSSMSLTPSDLAAAGRAFAGRELAAPPVTHKIRPSAADMSRLLNLHAIAAQIAHTAPELIAQPETARALEQTLIHAMVACLTGSVPVEMGNAGRNHMAVIAKLEEFLAENCERPVYLAEICAATGVSERTLRVCCQEHLGMGPIRYLWLRRMHLVRRALVWADSRMTNVTKVATEFGFWELGRLSVEYQSLFGESPSTTLARPPEDRRH